MTGYLIEDSGVVYAIGAPFPPASEDALIEVLERTLTELKSGRAKRIRESFTKEQLEQLLQEKLEEQKRSVNESTARVEKRQEVS